MLRELFRIPGLDLPVYGYGLMLVLGVWSAIELARYLANRLGLPGDEYVPFGMVALFSGVIGARLSHVLENLGRYTDPERSAWENFVAAINITGGGLTFYGGFIFATICLYVFVKVRKLPVRLTMDLIAPCLMLGLAFGRVGCLLNGCCWGQTCDPDRVPWAMTFPYESPPHAYHFETFPDELDVPEELVRPTVTEDGGYVVRDGRVVMRLVSTEAVAGSEQLSALAATSRSLPVHPTQLYSVINALLIGGVTLLYLAVGPAPGRVFGAMLLMYGPSRFALELLRVNDRLAGDLTYSMWVSIGVTVAGVVLYVVAGRLPRPSRPTTAASSASA